MDNLMTLISNAKRSMDEYILKEMSKRGYKTLSISDGLVLINLVDNEVMNYKELSKRVGKSPQTMTTLIRKLERESFIELEVDLKDKRNKLVHLTKKGKEFLPVLFEISKNLYDRQYKGFTEEEKRMINILVPKLTSNFKD